MSMKGKTSLGGANFGALLLSVSLLSIFVSVDSQCQKKPVLFNFGDSNSDTGEFCLVNGISFQLPTGRTFFHRPMGRLCDGRLIIDFLCESLNMSYLTPFMESVDPNFTNGVNFALTGSRAVDLDVQVGQFLQFRLRSFDVKSNHSISEEDLENALYMMDIGQNDLAGAFVSLSYEQVIDLIPSYISEIQSSIMKLYQNGGRNFWVHNTGPLGCLPEIIVLTHRNESDLDTYGCVESRNNAAKQFNEQLFALCEKLRSELNDAKIVYVDMYSIKYDVITNPSLYGFANPLMACCGHGGPPYNYEANKSCGSIGFNVCGEDEKFISWDGVHYSEAANAVFASKILSASYSFPQLKFQYFCNA